MADAEGYVAKLEACRRVAPDGSEYWLARDLRGLLGYDEWRNFSGAIDKAQEACGSAGAVVSHHFVGINKMVNIGSGAKRVTDDWYLSRYACYLIALNSDASKPEVGAAMTYFVVKARLQELQDKLTDAERRALQRERLRDAHKALGEAAKNANVERYAIFHDAGYKRLYAGLGIREIKKRKGIAEKDDLWDCIGRPELAINEFRVTQAEQKIIREKINTEEMAIRAHGEVATEVRAAIEKMGGQMPEDLPAEPNINKLVSSKRRKELRELNRSEPPSTGSV